MRALAALVASALLLGAAPAANAYADAAFSRSLEAGLQAFYTRDFRQARAQFEAALAVVPDNTLAISFLNATAAQTPGDLDALIAAEGNLAGRTVQLCAMESKFIGGSMGSVVGEKIARAIDRAILQRNPLIVVSASGGARMQEGAVSLMQMAKISAGLMKLDQARLPYISILTDPTTGGVTASYAMLGDLNIAEPGALIGFAGPRVIEQTIRQKLPEGFQRSEFLLKHGMLDDVVPRLEMKPYLARALKFLAA